MLSPGHFWKNRFLGHNFHKNPGLLHLSRPIQTTKIRWQHLQMIIWKVSERKCKQIPLWWWIPWAFNSDVFSHVEPAESQFCPTRLLNKTNPPEKNASHVAVSGWRLKPEGVRSTLLFFCFLNIFLLPDPILMTGFYLLDISEKIDFWIIIFIKIQTGRACPGRYHSLEWNIILVILNSNQA